MSRDDRLSRIADLLGLSVECLRSGGGLEHLDGAALCLMLWQQIESAEGRRKALAALSRIAGEEPSKRKGAFTIGGSDEALPIA